MQINEDEVVWDAPGAGTGPAPAPPPPPAPAAQPRAAAPTINESEIVWDKPAAPTPVPAERSTMQGLGRQLGLTARHAITGVAALPAMAADAVTGPINAGLDKVVGEGQGYRFKRQAPALDNTLTKLGFPAPENAKERVVGDVTSALAGTGATVKAGQKLADVGGNVLQRLSKGVPTAAVGEGLAAAPRAQLVTAAAGSGAAGATREAGGGEGAQAAAGLAASILPTAAPYAAKAAVRGALRGGEAGRQRVANNIATFEAAGAGVPSVGQATESRVARGMESGLAKVPGGAGVMNRFAQAQSDNLAASVAKLSAELAPDASAANAGEAITRGINAFKAGFKAEQGRMYGVLEQFLPKDAPIQVQRSQQALSALNEAIEGAPELSKFFRNSKIADIQRAFGADLKRSAEAALPKGGPQFNPGAPDVQNASLPLEAVKKIRSLVGEEISNNSLMADVPRSKWRALYGALSEDLGEAASRAGPEAKAQWDRVNAFGAEHMRRLDELSSIVSRDAPEKVFQAALSGTDQGNTVISRVMTAIPVENRREVAAAVLQKMGRATPGKQNELGSEFSSETFLTNLARLSPKARETLFGALDQADVPQRVGQMGRVAANRREGSQVFSNPSGTGQSVAQLATGVGLGGSIMSGNPAAIALAAGVPTGANVGARLATSEHLVRSLGRRTQLDPSAGASAANALARTTLTREPEDERSPRARLARP